jgi:hypothetical protein
MFSRIINSIRLAFIFILGIVNDYVVPAIDIVESIKDAVNQTTDSKLKKTLIDYFGKNYDNPIVETIKATLLKLNWITPDATSTNEEVVRQMIEKLKTTPEVERNAIYSLIARELTKESGKDHPEISELKDHQLDTLVQMKYSDFKSNSDQA